MRSVLRLLASGLVLSVLFVASAYSQGAQTGGITGVVTDQGGALVKGATVDVISATTGRAERTVNVGDDGSFTASLLPPGSYTLEVTAPNFKKAVIAGVKVNITETTRQDVSLEVGKIQETVNVEAAPSLINPSSAQTGQAIDSQTLNTLPLASPNFLFLLSLSSGVSGEPTDVRTAGRGTADVSVNGQRTSNNSVSLNGINVNDFNLAHFDTVPLPNPDTLQEMKVATSLYDATQGSKGGGALGLVTKTGTKNFHWDLTGHTATTTSTPMSTSSTRPAQSAAGYCRTFLAAVPADRFRKLAASGSLIIRACGLATASTRLARAQRQRCRHSRSPPMAPRTRLCWLHPSV